MTPRFATFAQFLAAIQQGDLDRSRVRIAEFTSSGSVEACYLSLPTAEDDSYREEVLYRSDSLETFLKDVGAALGIEANIW